MKLLLKHADILVLENNTWKTLKDAYLGVDGDTICYLSEERPKDGFDREKDLRTQLSRP